MELAATIVTLILAVFVYPILLYTLYAIITDTGNQNEIPSTYSLFAPERKEAKKLWRQKVEAVTPVLRKLGIEHEFWNSINRTLECCVPGGWVILDYDCLGFSDLEGIIKTSLKNPLSEAEYQEYLRNFSESCDAIGHETIMESLGIPNKNESL